MARRKHVIASSREWVAIERPGGGNDNWVNLWLSARSQNIDRADFLVSYNLSTRRFNDCPAWKRMQIGYPEVASWFEEAVRDRYKLTGD